MKIKSFFDTTPPGPVKLKLHELELTRYLCLTGYSCLMGAGASTTLTVEQTDALCNAALAYSTEETSPPTLRVELQKYIRMRKVGVPLEACLQSMIVIGQQRDGLTTKDIQHFTTWCATHTEITQDDLARAFSSPARYNTEGESKHDNHAADLTGHPEEIHAKAQYIQLRTYGLMMDAILQKFTAQGTFHTIKRVKFVTWCGEWEQNYSKGKGEQRRLNGERMGSMGSAKSKLEEFFKSDVNSKK